MLVSVPLNGSSTFSSLYGNYATIQNRGFELEFDASVLSKDSQLKWNLFGNWSTNRNKVTELQGTESLFLNGFTGSSSRAVLNQPLGVLWGGKFDRDASGALILDANGFPTAAASEGVIGDPNPKWRGALGTSFSYKNFKISTLFDASIGGQLWDGTSGALNNFGKTMETANEVTVTADEASKIKNYNGQTIDKLTTANADGSYTLRGNLEDFGGGKVLLDQSWYTGLGGGFGSVSQDYIKDASWFRLREISLNYNLEITNISTLSVVTF